MESIQLRMSALTDGGYEAIRKAVESLLSEVGFAVNNQAIRKAFHEAGGHVDDERKLVKLPAALLWELVKKAPRSYRLAGVNGDQYEVGAGDVFKAAIVTDPFIADYPTGAMRKPRLSDVVRNTRIIQSQADVCQVSFMDYPVEDVAGPASRYRAMEVHLLNHAKPYAVYPTSYQSFMEWLEIGHILTAGSPLHASGLFTVAIAVLSPLTLTSGNCDILLKSLQYGFPVIPTTCPMAGSTSPYTFSGTLVQGIAESLIVLCSAQVMSPGNPVLSSFGASITEMSRGRDLYYTVDKALWKMSAAAFAKRLGLPFAVEAGGALNCRYDMQSGAEGMLMAFTALMSGADVLAGSGSCLNANGVSAEFILSHYAFLDAARHLKTGYSLSGMERSLNAIRKQGCGGNFLMDDVTMERLRDSEFFSSALFDEAGEAGEGKSMLERAHEEAVRLDGDFRSPLPEKIAGALREHFDKLCAGC